MVNVENFRNWFVGLAVPIRNLVLNNLIAKLTQIAYESTETDIPF